MLGVGGQTGQTTHLGPVRLHQVLGESGALSYWMDGRVIVSPASPSPAGIPIIPTSPCCFKWRRKSSRWQTLLVSAPSSETSDFCGSRLEKVYSLVVMVISLKHQMRASRSFETEAVAKRETIRNNKITKSHETFCLIFFLHTDISNTLIVSIYF